MSKFKPNGMPKASISAIYSANKVQSRGNVPSCASFLDIPCTGGDASIIVARGIMAAETICMNVNRRRPSASIDYFDPSRCFSVAGPSYV